MIEMWEFMFFVMFRECVLLMMFALTLVMMIVMMMMMMMMVMMTPVIIGAAPKRQLKLSHISETKPTPAHHGMDDHDHGMVLRRIMIMIMNMTIDHASMVTMMLRMKCGRGRKAFIGFSGIEPRTPFRGSPFQLTLFC